MSQSQTFGCESWTIKNAECWRIDAFELWCWRRFFRVPWIARKSNQSILKKISPQYLLEGLMLKLKFQYFGHLMQRTDSLEKILMLGNIQGRRRRWRPRKRWLNGITDLNMSLNKLGELVIDREAWRAVVHWVAKSRTWLSEWPELNWGTLQDTIWSQIKGAIEIHQATRGQIKGVQTLHTSRSLWATLPLNHCYKIPHQIPLAGVCCIPLWQANH